MDRNQEFNEYLSIADQAFLDKKIRVERDQGPFSLSAVRLFEKSYHVRLPRLYVRFITQHNGASLENDCFDYSGTRGGIRFDEFGRVIDFTESIRADRDEDYDTYPDYLIPFGDDGGEGVIFFSYEHDRSTDEPKVVLIAEGDEAKVASSFEDFIDMLYVDEERLSENLADVEQSAHVTLPDCYKTFCVRFCTQKFNTKLRFRGDRWMPMFPGAILWHVSDWNEKHFKTLIPFCTNADGTMICFKRTEEGSGSGLPVVVWAQRDPERIEVEHVANNFEEFVNMLHEPEDE